ncbi:V-type proton ATPase subunit H [Thraustotheca clavata]|uniref:V-type proton ATPase subunit H n=1 Tax=Thraustotheca clavata TaxID=74557 RepID=A0A1W0A553_9STRA|nr:V-type proton ATPase subunit H [Thraustotheca clavata]
MSLGSSAADAKMNALDVALAREEALAKFKDINWGTYSRPGGFSLDKNEISAIKEMETIAKTALQNEDQTDAIIDTFLKESGDALGHGLLKLIKNVTEPSVLRYAFARIDELLPDGGRLRKRIGYFIPEGTPIDAAPFLRLLRSETGYTQYAAGYILAQFLTVRPKEQDIAALIQWILDALKASAQMTDPVRAAAARNAVTTLMVLLRNNSARVLFAKADGLRSISEVLKNSQGRAQLAYELSFCLWTLSFCSEAVEKFGSSGALNALIQQVIAAPREKVVRVALEALQNLLGKKNGTYNEAMIDGGLLKTLTNLRERKWTDEDITKSIQSVRDVLIREFKELNTMERYEKELRTGALNWGLLHTDKFWRENYMSFETKEFELIRLLIDLLESEDPKTVAVALYDLGDFVRFYPNGKHIAKRLGAKKVAMKLMTHENAEVQKHALQCISKMMVNKWEFVK